jgi:curli production assembly/transport component CsgG
MKKLLIPTLLATVFLTGCANFNTTQLRTWEDPVATVPELKKESDLAPPAAGPITVAVYSFRDMTGQRKATQNIASLSSAVTQGADNYLIQSLQTVGNGRWFRVVERGGLDNIIKERQLIRQMRELYEGDKAQPLPPMVFAGILLEGGIVGYDSNTISGGNGARLLGIGASTEYRQDEVIISLRAVSVATGEVLSTIMVKKTVASVQDRLGVLRFYEMGTKAFELESGSAANESMNHAVQLAVHAAVIELIKDGAAKGHWNYSEVVKIKIEEEATEATEVQKTE